MIDHSFRKILPNYTRSLIALYKWLHLAPNQITLFSFGIACIAALLVSQKYFVAAIFVWWLGRLLDGTDGVYARANGQTSLFGAYLDMLCDMASYSVMILGFKFAFPELTPVWAVILLLYVLCITGALSLGSLQEKKKVPSRDNRGLRLAAGLAEGGETGIAYTVFLMLPGLVSFTAWAWVVVLVITVVARSMIAYRELKQ